MRLVGRAGPATLEVRGGSLGLYETTVTRSLFTCGPGPALLLASGSPLVRLRGFTTNGNVSVQSGSVKYLRSPAKTQAVGGLAFEGGTVPVTLRGFAGEKVSGFYSAIPRAGFGPLDVPLFLGAPRSSNLLGHASAWGRARRRRARSGPRTGGHGDVNGDGYTDALLTQDPYAFAPPVAVSYRLGSASGLGAGLSLCDDVLGCPDECASAGDSERRRFR